MTRSPLLLQRWFAAVSALVALMLALGAHAPCGDARHDSLSPACAGEGQGEAARQSLRFQLDTVRTRIGFFADATAGPFEGTAERHRGYAELSDTVRFAHATGRVEIDVASFRTGIGMRDGHLRGELDADQYPTIVYELTRIHRSDEPVPAEAGLGIADGEPERAPVVLYGKLTVRGVTRELGSYALVRFSADSVYVLGRVPIRFTDFGMEPPKRVLGLTRVRDRLVLFFDAVFAAGPSPSDVDVP